jgi:lysozyme
MKSVFRTLLFLTILYAPKGVCQTAKSTTANSTPLISGIDISHYQGDEISYLNKKGNQMTFIICKATEGVTVIDPDFNNNWKMISENGFVRGAYHFYHCADDPTQQANYFLAALGTLSKTDFPPIVDFEENSIDKSCNVADIQKNLLQFLTILEQKTGRKPLLYTDTNTGNSHLNNSAFAGYRLWIADYNPGTSPAVPTAWKNSTWTIWQKTQDYSLETYTNDFDVFNGNDSDFIQLLQGK